MSVPLFNLAPNLTVSRLCLGTMTFGEQNSLPQTLRLLDQAFDAGINFFDSAEMYGVPHASSQTLSEFSAFFWLFMFIFYLVKYRYPVPQRAETQGKSEEYFGQWVRKRKISRDRVVIATKVAGPSGQMSWIRDGPKCLDAKNITEAVDGRLVPYVMDFVSSVAPEMSPGCSLFEIILPCNECIIMYSTGSSILQILTIFAC
ncbi:hypothetical protein Goklo_020152 [Gossypium klotzschianum]|uniref:NADP-dependent oxidoreductase domain-containing protein n=1 Tax=Gossypium klotzschianum TaxID=34286 RepID=A0A7J8UR05_9ROSI|nr:hypothetical protein [Gossypium klotzschianum]